MWGWRPALPAKPMEILGLQKGAATQRDVALTSAKLPSPSTRAASLILLVTQ